MKTVFIKLNMNHLFAWSEILPSSLFKKHHIERFSKFLDPEILKKVCFLQCILHMTHLLKILRGTRHSLVFFFSQVRTKASVKHETPTVTHRLSYKISHPDREHTHGKKNHSNLWKWFKSHFLFLNLSKSENTSVRNLIVCFTKLKYQEFMVQISQALCFLKEMGYVIELNFLSF